MTIESDIDDLRKRVGHLESEVSYLLKIKTLNEIGDKKKCLK